MPAKREFLPGLRELEVGPAVPIPERMRILRELEFDLEQRVAAISAAHRDALGLDPSTPLRKEMTVMDELWYSLGTIRWPLLFSMLVILALALGSARRLIGVNASASARTKRGSTRSFSGARSR